MGLYDVQQLMTPQGPETPSITAYSEVNYKTLGKWSRHGENLPSFLAGAWKERGLIKKG
jgi:hypothetical protein